MAIGTIDRRWLAICLALLVGSGSRVIADGDERDHETARRLEASGEIVPLSHFLSQLEPGGRILEVELERKRGRWIYDFEVLRGGEVWEYEFDAATGRLLKRKRD